MEKRVDKRKRNLKRFLLVLLSLVIIAIRGFLIYANDYYQAEDLAVEAIVEFIKINSDR